MLTVSQSPVASALRQNQRRPHAIVIGSGFGGLAAAIRLGARGFRVSVLEKLDAPGGRAYVFRQDGFTFDAGPTIITAPFLFDELWSLCGRKVSDDVDLRPLSPFYTIRFDDGEILRCSGDAGEMRREIRRIAPDDLDGYERFMSLAEKIYKTGFEELGSVPFLSWRDMAKVAPDLVRLQSYRTIYGLAARYVRDPRLRIALSFHPLFVGGNPFSVTSIYGLISFLERKWGVHFAMGGTGRLIDGMVRLVRGQGSTVHFNSEVRDILVDKGKATGVRLANGQTIYADVVVSNADAASTYHTLVSAEPSRVWAPRKVEAARHSMSLFVWYFGTRKRYLDVGHHTILLGPRYKGLLDDIFKRKVLAEDFSLYLHRPTATDPSLAPEGCDSFYVLSPVPNLQGNVDWSRAAESYRDKIAARLEQTLLPDFTSHIVTSRVVTPLYFRDALNSYQGAAFSFEPLLTQSAWFRPHNRSEDIKNLFLVGAGTHPGAGVPGVLSSAKILDSVVPDAATFAS